MQTWNWRTRTRTVVTAAVLLLAASGTQSVLAAPEGEQQSLLTEKPLLRVATFGQAPNLDGVLDDPAWSTARPATPFWHYQAGVQSEHDTWAKIGIDNDHLYVAFHCAEAEMAKLKAEKLPPDSLSVYANDHVEFFFMPDALGGPYYHFSADVGGNRHDELASDGSWGCEWDAAVRLGTDAWSVEMRIPRRAVGLSDPQMSLANFCRTRRLAPPETSAWSKTFGLFHNPARFGRTVYGPTTGVSLKALTLRRPRPGENHVNVAISGAERPMDVVVKGYVPAGEDMTCFGTRKLRLSEGADSSVSLGLRV